MDRFTCSVPQAGHFWGLKKWSAYEAAKKGELPTVKIGRKLRVPIAALAEDLGVTRQEITDALGEARDDVLNEPSRRHSTAEDDTAA